MCNQQKAFFSQKPLLKVSLDRSSVSVKAGQRWGSVNLLGDGLATVSAMLTEFLVTCNLFPKVVTDFLLVLPRTLKATTNGIHNISV